MKRILLGGTAKDYLKLLEATDYMKIDNLPIMGGVFEEERVDGKGFVYIGFDCRSTEVTLEEFDDIVEACKYARGIKSKTISGYEI